MTMPRDAARDAREAQHYDRVARSAEAVADPTRVVGPEDLSDPGVEWLPFLGIPAFTAALLDAVGPVAGRRVLDLGSGTGFLSIALALAHRGAEVDSVDISPASIEVARERAAASGVGDRVRFHVGKAETLPFEDGRFDAACGLFVLHHTDLSATARELRRVLRPGAPAAFVETLGRNPVLSAARALLPGRFGIEKASTDDERPLAGAALATLSEAFGEAVTLTYPEVVFVRMGAYLRPLQSAPARAVLAGVDRGLGAIGVLNRLSYFGLVTIRTPAADGPGPQR